MSDQSDRPIVTQEQSDALAAEFTKLKELVLITRPKKKSTKPTFPPSRD